MTSTPGRRALALRTRCERTPVARRRASAGACAPRFEHALCFNALSHAVARRRTPSRLAFGRRLVFCNSELDWFARLFCPDPAMRADASPLRADLPDDLPPALFSVGTCDALLDDTLELARRWPAPSDLVVYPGAAHGVGHFGPHEHTAQGEDLLRRVDAYVGAAFSRLGS